MQVLLTLTAELLVVVVAGAIVFDFLAGLLHLYSTSIPTSQGKEPQDESAPATSARQSISPDSSCLPIVEDPWTAAEPEPVNQCFCCHDDEIAPTIYLLPPAMPEVIEQHGRQGVEAPSNGRQGVEGTSTQLPPQLPPETVNYSWTIRALKKEAQRRQLKRYSSLTKSQLITALTAL